MVKAAKNDAPDMSALLRVSQAAENSTGETLQPDAKKPAPKKTAAKKSTAKKKTAAKKPVKSKKPVEPEQSEEEAQVVVQATNTKTITMVTLNKKPLKDNWPRLSIKASPNVYKAIGYLLHHPDLYIKSQQDVFERFMYNQFLALAKEHGYEPEEEAVAET